MADKHDVIQTVLTLSSELSSSLLLHVEDVATFVSDDDLAKSVSVEDMAEEEKQCIANLAQLLDTLDATPGPPRVQARVAAMPYTEIHVLIPRLVADKQRLIDICQQAAQRVGDWPAAVERIASVTQRHQQHLANLQEMAKAHTS